LNEDPEEAMRMERSADAEILPPPMGGDVYWARPLVVAAMVAVATQLPRPSTGVTEPRTASRVEYLQRTF
jgi:hypothetical protein